MSFVDFEPACMENLTPDCFYRTYATWQTPEGEKLIRWLTDRLPHGAGIDGDWEITESPSTGRIRASNSFHAMDEDGYYDGWMPFTAIFNRRRPHSEAGSLLELRRITFGARPWRSTEYLKEVLCQDLDYAVSDSYHQEAAFTP